MEGGAGVLEKREEEREFEGKIFRKKESDEERSGDRSEQQRQGVLSSSFPPAAGKTDVYAVYLLLSPPFTLAD